MESDMSESNVLKEYLECKEYIKETYGEQYLQQYEQLFEKNKQSGFHPKELQERFIRIINNGKSKDEMVDLDIQEKSVRGLYDDLQKSIPQNKIDVNNIDNLFSSDFEGDPKKLLEPLLATGVVKLKGRLTFVCSLDKDNMQYDTKEEVLESVNKYKRVIDKLIDKVVNNQNKEIQTKWLNKIYNYILDGFKKNVDEYPDCAISTSVKNQLDNLNLTKLITNGINKEKLQEYFNKMIDDSIFPFFDIEIKDKDILKKFHFIGDFFDRGGFDRQTAMYLVKLAENGADFTLGNHDMGCRYSGYYTPFVGSNYSIQARNILKNRLTLKKRYELFKPCKIMYFGKGVDRKPVYCGHAPLAYNNIYNTNLEYGKKDILRYFRDKLCKYVCYNRYSDCYCVNSAIYSVGGTSAKFDEKFVANFVKELNNAKCHNCNRVINSLSQCMNSNDYELEQIFNSNSNNNNNIQDKDIICQIMATTFQNALFDTMKGADIEIENVDDNLQRFLPAELYNKSIIGAYDNPNGLCFFWNRNKWKGGEIYNDKYEIDNDNIVKYQIYGHDGKELLPYRLNNNTICVDTSRSLGIVSSFISVPDDMKNFNDIKFHSFKYQTKQWTVENVKDNSYKRENNSLNINSNSRQQEVNIISNYNNNIIKDSRRQRNDNNNYNNNILNNNNYNNINNNNSYNNNKYNAVNYNNSNNGYNYNNGNYNNDRKSNNILNKVYGNMVNATNDLDSKYKNVNKNIDNLDTYL